MDIYTYGEQKYIGYYLDVFFLYNRICGDLLCIFKVPKQNWYCWIYIIYCCNSVYIFIILCDGSDDTGGDVFVCAFGMD